jgi:hypothetical protein
MLSLSRYFLGKYTLTGVVTMSSSSSSVGDLNLMEGGFVGGRPETLDGAYGAPFTEAARTGVTVLGGDVGRGTVTVALLGGDVERGGMVAILGGDVERGGMVALLGGDVERGGMVVDIAPYVPGG